MESKSYQNNNNHVERCDCGTPIVKRLSSRKLEFLKYHNGQPVKIITEYSGDKCDVRCEQCGRSITFMTNKIQLGLTYVVAPPRNSS